MGGVWGGRIWGRQVKRYSAVTRVFGVHRATPPQNVQTLRISDARHQLAGDDAQALRQRSYITLRNSAVGALPTIDLSLSKPYEGVA